MITRTRLRCNEKDCPRRDDEDFHKPVCYAIPDVEHSNEAQHQHWPKRSQGGKTVVAVICSWCHDKIDNGRWGNAVEDGVYRIWDVHGKTLLRVSTAEGEADGSVRPASEQPPASPSAADVRGPSAAAEDVGSAVAPGASSDGGERDGHGDPVASDSPPSPDAGADSREPPSYPAAVTRSSAAKPSGGDGVDAPPAKGPSPPILPAECRLEEALEIAKQIGNAKNQNPWDAGDWVLETEQRWPQEYTQGITDLGYSTQSLLNVVRVCRTFQNVQRDIATFTHYQTALKVASESLPDALQWLKRSTVAEWSVTEFRRQLGKALPELYNTKPKTVRYTLSDLREDLAAWPGEPSVRNNARRWAEAWLDSLEATA